jgi:hypothetical protein
MHLHVHPHASSLAATPQHSRPYLLVALPMLSQLVWCYTAYRECSAMHALLPTRCAPKRCSQTSCDYCRIRLQEFHLKTLHNRTSCSSYIQVRQVASLHPPMPRAAASFTSTAYGEGLQVPAALSALGSAGQALHQSPSGSYAQGITLLRQTALRVRPINPGATPALGSPSASLPACTPAPASQYPAGDRGLSLYTPPHITAQAMIPPSAILFSARCRSLASHRMGMPAAHL